MHAVRANVVCGTTDFGEAWNCRAPAIKGSWDVRSEEECLAKCIGCERCNYISLVPAAGDRSADCSWFTRCNLHSTDLMAVAGAHSRRIRSLNGTVLEDVAQVAQRHALREQEADG